MTRHFGKKQLETHNPFTTLIRWISVPVLNYLPPRLLRSVMKASSKDADRVIRNVGFSHALEVVYTRHERRPFEHGIFRGIADFFWHHATSQAKALRNRLKIVEELLEGELEHLQRSGWDSIRVLTVGGGSARALIHALARFKRESPGIPVSVVNIDKDQAGIELGEQNAEKYGVRDSFKYVFDDARNIAARIELASLDIVEMVGLMDYFSDERAVEVILQIHAALRSGGLFVVANVHPNWEQRFLHNFGWPAMHYRTTEDVRVLLRRSGFTNEADIMLEPLGVHIIATVRK